MLMRYRIELYKPFVFLKVKATYHASKPLLFLNFPSLTISSFLRKIVGSVERRGRASKAFLSLILLRRGSLPTSLVSLLSSYMPTEWLRPLRIPDSFWLFFCLECPPWIPFLTYLANSHSFSKTICAWCLPGDLSWCLGSSSHALSS